MPTSFDDLRDDYASRWEAMQIRPEWAARARQQAERILAAKRHYEPVSGATGVPWGRLAPSGTVMASASDHPKRSRL